MSTRTEALLQIRGVSKAYGGISVLDNLGFALSAGEAIGVVGPNGSGKSTLLRCLVGTEFVDGGEILIEGAQLDERDPYVRAAIAALLDDADYFPDLSVLEHLRLLAWAHGTADAESVVNGVIAELALDAVKDQLPPTLSSGQRHRFGLASCLVRPRKILVLDEPEQRLDAAGRTWLRSRLHAEKNSGVAIVLASHDTALIESVSDRVVDVGL